MNDKIFTLLYFFGYFHPSHLLVDIWIVHLFSVVVELSNCFLGCLGDFCLFPSKLSSQPDQTRQIHNVCVCDWVQSSSLVWFLWIRLTIFFHQKKNFRLFGYSGEVHIKVFVFSILARKMRIGQWNWIVFISSYLDPFIHRLIDCVRKTENVFFFFGFFLWFFLWKTERTNVTNQNIEGKTEEEEFLDGNKKKIGSKVT